jgi:hypothetical protein
MYLGHLVGTWGIAILASGFSFRASAKRLIHRSASASNRLAQHRKSLGSTPKPEARKPKPDTSDLGPNPSRALECSVTSAIDTR